MAFRFGRRSLQIIPGVRLNFGKKGTSVSVGGRGARVTYGADGATTHTLGIPGTGVSWSKKTRTKREEVDPALPPPLPPGAGAEEERNRRIRLLEALQDSQKIPVYYFDGDEVKGPVALFDVISKATRGGVSEKVRVCPVGGQDWEGIPLDQLALLNELRSEAAERDKPSEKERASLWKILLLVFLGASLLVLIPVVMQDTKHRRAQLVDAAATDEIPAGEDDTQREESKKELVPSIPSPATELRTVTPSPEGVVTSTATPVPSIGALPVQYLAPASSTPFPWSGYSSSTTTGTSHSTGGSVQVRSYVRKDGTVVRAHTRSK